MIPIKLQLCNFMCYRGAMPPLDFRGLHVACLAGQNGHGKSALLDAMTWALWGKARTSRDNDLISLGETEMEVEFEFALGGNTYRIIRKRSAQGRGRSVLELQVAQEGRYNALTEPSIRQTQGKIDALLRMDYDTFINSAFLLQGRANEFTTKSPAELKRILGEILGLSIYDAYEQRAKEMAREVTSELRAVKARIQEMERELRHEPQYEAELAQAREETARLSQELDDLEPRVNRLRQEQRLLELQRKQEQQLQARLTRGAQELDQMGKQASALTAKQDHLAGILSKRQEIEAGHQELQAARSDEAAQSAKLSELMELNQAKSRLEQAIHAARVELESRRRARAEALAELERKAAQVDGLRGALGESQAKLSALALKEGERETKRAQAQANLEEIAALQATNERLRQDMEEIKEKIALLQVAQAKCPLCGNDLTEAHQAELLAEFEASGKARGDQYRDNKARMGELEKANKGLARACRDLDRALAAQADLQREHARLERDLSEAEGAEASTQEARQQVAQLEAQLAEGAFASQAREELAALEARITRLGYDREAHETARKRAQELAHFQDDAQELATAARLLEETGESLERLRASQARLQESLQADREQLEALEATLAAAQGLEAELREQAQRLQTLRQQESQARLKLGAAQQKLEHCQNLKAERERQQDQARQLSTDESLYQELQVAFGQKGLRAMIIESAIPEIEAEANRLLARMTENRMHVTIETQRETLKKDVVETLDIKIADELGTRDYEMYSGGEAFRVDFAIRIALSTLLARRAGAQLQTLVIDEGFGTQDAQGRERLVEAINAIREDFACVLVITHIEELQDAFPVRINVTKTPQGSQFALV